MASYDPLLGTRTVLPANWWTRLCSFLNFDIFIHGLHHRHPKLAHDQLGPTMQQFIDDHPKIDYPVYRSYWRAAWAMLPSLLNNPGCGVNVGTPPPAMSAESQNPDFTSDVWAPANDTPPAPDAEAQQPDASPMAIDRVGR
jgi:hypothetical protein